MINSNMRLSELLNEDYDFTKLDSWWNPDAANYAEEQRERTDQIEKDSDGTPVFTRDIKHPKNSQMTTDPQPNTLQSPGYRGREELKKRAGLRHKEFQQYDPTAFKQDLPTSTSPQ